ncbi:hypothetical protein ACFXO2_29720 [Streptomyces sp. NPDC059152]|uniref:hypothetical protein n=1 Tax=Streptomyces sp. NPDC059152 TaxID=3346742 RepID=UPI00367AA89C
MRRLATTLGILGASVALTLGVTQSASAAAGTLHLNGDFFQNPTGCNRSENPAETGLVSNWTDSIACVYSDPSCQEFVGIAMPFTLVEVPHAWSVRYN